MAKTVSSIVARLLIFIATFIAAIVMATSHGEVDFITHASYNFFPEFKYFVVATGIGSGYELLIVLLPSGSMLWRLVILLDLIISFLLTTSSTLALSVLLNLKNGNTKVGWHPICPEVPNFCSHLSGAVAIGFIGCGLCLSLLFYSLHIIINPLLVPEETEP